MDTHDLYLGTQYILLGAAAAAYGSVAGLMLVSGLGYVVAAVAIWFLARGAVDVVEYTATHGLQPQNYRVVHYGGVSLATLGILGAIQAVQGWLLSSMAVSVAAVGGLFVSGGLYERYKRRATQHA